MSLFSRQISKRWATMIWHPSLSVHCLPSSLNTRAVNSFELTRGTWNTETPELYFDTRRLVTSFDHHALHSYKCTQAIEDSTNHWNKSRPSHGSASDKSRLRFSQLDYHEATLFQSGFSACSSSDTILNFWFSMSAAYNTQILSVCRRDA